MAWDLRWPAADPTDLSPRTDLAPWESPDRGPLALPGRYTATLEARRDGELSTLAGPVDVDVVPLELATLAAEDKAAVMAFQTEVRDLKRAVLGASETADEVDNRIEHLRQALRDTPGADPALMAELELLKGRLDAILLELEGDRTKAERNVFTPPSIRSRVTRISSDMWSHTQPPTATHRQTLAWAEEAFASELARLQSLVADLESLEAQAEDAGAPWTPGRVPVWTP
jgi:hypothetical protein